MPINEAKPVRISQYRDADGNVVTKRVGIDDGRAFPPDTVVVEIGQQLLQADAAEAENYFRSNAQETADASRKTRAATITSVVDIVEYLRLKFPEDFP